MLDMFIQITFGALLTGGTFLLFALGVKILQMRWRYETKADKATKATEEGE